MGKRWTSDDEGYWQKTNSVKERDHTTQRPRSIIGPGNCKKLRVLVISKYEVFISRFYLDTSIGENRRSVIDVLSDVNVTVSKLRTLQESYASFSSFVNPSTLHCRNPIGMFFSEKQNTDQGRVSQQPANQRRRIHDPGRFSGDAASLIGWLLRNPTLVGKLFFAKKHAFGLPDRFS